MVICICLIVSGACSALGGILSALFMMSGVKSFEGIEALRARLLTISGLFISKGTVVLYMHSKTSSQQG